MAYIIREQSNRPTARFHIDFENFRTDVRRMLSDHWPRAVSQAIGRLAEAVHKEEYVQAHHIFKLHTDWIPNNFVLFPRTTAQFSRMERDVKSKGTCFASVSLSSNIDQWMSIHEYGGTRTPTAHSPRDKGRKLAVPINSQNRQMKTSTGRTASRYKIAELLKDYKPNVAGTTRQKTRQRKPFIIHGTRFSWIVRALPGKTRQLEWLYLFIPRARIKPEWHFEDSGMAFIQKNYMRICEKELNKHIDKINH